MTFLDLYQPIWSLAENFLLTSSSKTSSKDKIISSGISLKHLSMNFKISENITPCGHIFMSVITTYKKNKS